MKVLDDGRIQCRVRITGTLNGVPWVYEDPEDEDGSQYIDGDDPSFFWWSEGNFSCDCNRARFLPDDLFEQLPKGDDPNNPDDPSCGELILIDKIEPIEGEDLPILELNETEHYSAMTMLKNTKIIIKKE